MIGVRSGWGVFLLALGLGLGGCQIKRPALRGGTRLHIVETTGRGGDARTITLAATVTRLGDPSTLGGTRLALYDATLHARPAAHTATGQLAPTLDGVKLADAPAGDWPKSVSVVPPEARPLLARIQLALAIMRAPSDAPGVIDHSIGRLSSTSKTMGLTRVRTRGRMVSVDVLSIAIDAEGVLVGWADVAGRRTALGCELKGTRQLIGYEVEPVAIEMTWHAVGSSSARAAQTRP